MENTAVVYKFPVTGQDSPIAAGVIYRENGKKWLPRSFHEASPEKIIAQIDKVAIRYADNKERSRQQAVHSAMAILRKKSVCLRLYATLQESGVPVHPITLAVIRMAEGIRPGDPVTVDELHTLSGTRPEGVTQKWWSEKLPILMDDIGLTVKKSQTERRWAELFELENMRSTLHKIPYLIGDRCLVAADQLAKRMTVQSAYLERGKSGELIIYERPGQTSEGKEARRKAEMAAYLARQEKLRMAHEKSVTSHESDLGQLASYKPIILIGIFVVAMLFILAEMTPESPLTNSQATFMTPAAIAEGED